MFIGSHQLIVRLPVEEASPFKIDGVYCRLVPLTRDQYAIVDASDYEWLMQWKWHAAWNWTTRSFYAVRTITNVDKTPQCESMHRKILGLDDFNISKGDHISGVTLDDRRGNLRPVNAIRSSQNRGVFASNTSGTTGVTYSKRWSKWRASIRVDKVTLHLGSFKEKNDAIQARRMAVVKYFGEYARK